MLSRLVNRLTQKASETLKKKAQSLSALSKAADSARLGNMWKMPKAQVASLELQKNTVFVSKLPCTKTGVKKALPSIS